jgi:hypothetical protein
LDVVDPIGFRRRHLRRILFDAEEEFRRDQDALQTSFDPGLETAGFAGGGIEVE